MSSWFSMLGEPLAEVERAQLGEYLRGLGIDETLPIQSVSDWHSAGRAIANPEWDRRWWDAEQRERERLHEQARAARGETELLLSLSNVLEHSTEPAHGSAAVEAARFGNVEPALIRAAAGALVQALCLSKLAELAGKKTDHPFLVKHALFAGGHWPLGIVNGCFYIF
jgi:hypothetical protein